ncbi:MAG TPA: nuclear transport factor 2 family protein [Sphingobium sp.]|nr:nuclear transport factor 2 family protein [Sphingobium sp.]
MTFDDLIARESIRQTINNYNIAGDSRDAALFLAQFAQDAIFEFKAFPPLPGFRHEGIAAIRSMTEQWVQFPVDDPAYRPVSFIRHNVTTSRIDLTRSDSAAARTYFFVITDIGADHAGVYTDTLVRQGEHWLFAHRRITLDWRSADSIFPPVRR